MFIFSSQFGQGALPTPASRTRLGVTVKTASAKGLDLNQQGEVDGVPTFEFDLDAQEDKPWRKPGLPLFVLE